MKSSTSSGPSHMHLVHRLLLGRRPHEIEDPFPTGELRLEPRRVLVDALRPWVGEEATDLLERHPRLAQKRDPARSAFWESRAACAKRPIGVRSSVIR